MVATLTAVIDHGVSVSAVNYHPPVSAHNTIYQAPRPAGSPSPPTLLGQMVQKANNFCGRGQSRSLIDSYGSACLYCQKEQHCYAECKVFWSEVDAGKTVAPKNLRKPAHCSNKGKTNQVFNLTSKGIADRVLVNSEADIHMSGESPELILETFLTSPPTPQLVSCNNTSKLTGMGTLWIPTPSSMLDLSNVYYCPDIQSIILCLGILIEDGYKPIFNGTAH
ncbi:hypothetical protein O181_047900 [Austropuccinia psidii MF-1]|uniref:Uncharacterized protein n=1 Tax=Austropuccinia psidii MF-1 TaxID=1389203 RepID=A0A9Q3DR10_9BASI|nr:hypothetical protein [Austropuccinia psidii MF-1]